MIESITVEFNATVSGLRTEFGYAEGSLRKRPLFLPFNLQPWCCASPPTYGSIGLAIHLGSGCTTFLAQVGHLRLQALREHDEARRASQHICYEL